MRPSNPPPSLHNGRFGTYPSPLLMQLLVHGGHIYTPKRLGSPVATLWKRLRKWTRGCTSWVVGAKS